MYFMFSDEINWPEGEDAPPPDAQELITLLLRQNPLERMGTGENTKKEKVEQAISLWEVQRDNRPPQQFSLFQGTGGQNEVILLAVPFILWSTDLCDLINSNYSFIVHVSNSVHGQPLWGCANCKSNNDLEQNAFYHLDTQTFSLRTAGVFSCFYFHKNFTKNYNGKSNIKFMVIFGLTCSQKEIEWNEFVCLVCFNWGVQVLGVCYISAFVPKICS